MFDIGFSEIFVIALVALIVIGPERLPKVARTLGHLFGRMQRYVNDVKADISREMELDELRNLQSTVEDAARAIEQTVHKEVSTTESQLNSIAATAAETTPATAPATATGAVPGSSEAPASAANMPPLTEPEAPAATAPQLELGLDATNDAQRKQA
jgi:sec-independent protein translocase protein TatB